MTTRATVDLAAITRQKRLTRETEHRRSAAALLVAALAWGSLIAVNPFGAPGRDHPVAPQIAARPILPHTRQQTIIVPDRPRVAVAPPQAPVEQPWRAPVPTLPPSVGTDDHKQPAAPAPEQQMAGLPPIVMPEPPEIIVPVPLGPRETTAATPPEVLHQPELGVPEPPDGYLSEKSRATPPRVAATAPATPAPESGLPAFAEDKGIADMGVAPAPGHDAEQDLGFDRKLVLAAHQLTKIPGGYDPKYMKIAYPMGDVPEGMGVCTDVIVRAYRGLGIDLQELVHHSRLGTGDTNVDHRRVQVLIKFFAKYGENIPVSRFPESYKPGDIVAYDVPWGRTSKWHIAIVTDQLSPSLRPMVVHNRGYGAKLEDALFHKRIIGHYRLDAKGLMALQHKALPAQAAAGSSKPERRVLARVSVPRS